MKLPVIFQWSGLQFTWIESIRRAGLSLGLEFGEILKHGDAFSTHRWCSVLLFPVRISSGMPEESLLSQKKIARGMDFIVNKMGWSSKDVARNPGILLYSLEKRIVPRCLVIQVLSSKGLLEKDLNLNTNIEATREVVLEEICD